MSVATGETWCEEADLREAFLGLECAPGRYVYCEVADDGPGIDPDDLPRIFDPFFSSKGAGRGLGLASVLGVVRSHRGAIRVESRKGEGTRIRVLFAAAPGEARSAVKTEPQPPSPSLRGMVLLVDDDPAVRRVAAQMLHALGFEVCEAESGAEALDRVRGKRERFTLAIVDYSMPEMSGAELADELRRLHPELPILLSSGYDESDARRPTPESFLPKPYRLSELRRKVEQVLVRP